MGIEDLAGAAKNLFENDAVQGALHSEQAEGISDGILDKLEDAVGNATGHRFDDAIDSARGAIDGFVGDK